jgi:hypothetical protein
MGVHGQQSGVRVGVGVQVRGERRQGGEEKKGRTGCNLAATMHYANTPPHVPTRTSVGAVRVEDTREAVGLDDQGRGLGGPVGRGTTVPLVIPVRRVGGVLVEADVVVRLLRDGLHEKTKRVGVTESQGTGTHVCDRDNVRRRDIVRGEGGTKGEGRGKLDRHGLPTTRACGSK